MDELKARLVEIETELRTEQYRGGDMNTAKITALQQEYQDIQTQINQQSVMAQAADPESNVIISVAGLDVDLRAVTTNEANYQALAIAYNLEKIQVETDHAAQLAELQKQADDRYYQLEQELEQARHDLLDVRGKLEIAANEIKDLEIERDNFKRDAETAKAQLLTSHKPISNNLNGVEKLKQALAQAEAAKQAIFSVESISNTLSRGIDVLTGEPVEFNPLYKGKYRILTDEEAARFREEHKAQDHAPVVQPVEDTEVPSEPSQSVEVPPIGDGFHPAETPHDVSGVGGDTTQTDVVGQTLEARVAELERAVFGAVKNAA